MFIYLWLAFCFVLWGIFIIALWTPHGAFTRLLQRHLNSYDITRLASQRLYMRRFFLVHEKKGLIQHKGWDRFWIFQKLTRIRKYVPTIFLHYIARGDEDKWRHDHPWPFIAIPLTWWYREEDDTGTHLIWPLTARYRKATYRHRLHLFRPVWTLFIHFKREREWGFHTDQGWVDWKTYIPPEERAYHPETQLP